RFKMSISHFRIHGKNLEGRSRMSELSIQRDHWMTKVIGRITSNTTTHLTRCISSFGGQWS
ncbi:hypothetical protein AB1N83_013868, partial [Pleurotus pulmonarius]